MGGGEGWAGALLLILIGVAILARTVKGGSTSLPNRIGALAGQKV